MPRDTDPTSEPETSSANTPRGDDASPGDVMPSTAATEPMYGGTASRAPADPASSPAPPASMPSDGQAPSQASTVAPDPAPRPGWRSRAAATWNAGRRRRWLIPAAAAVALLAVGGVAGGAIGFANGLGADTGRSAHEASHMDRGDRGDGGDGGADRQGADRQGDSRDDQATRS